LTLIILLVTPPVKKIELKAAPVAKVTPAAPRNRRKSLVQIASEPAAPVVLKKSKSVAQFAREQAAPDIPFRQSVSGFPKIKPETPKKDAAATTSSIRQIIQGGLIIEKILGYTDHLRIPHWLVKFVEREEPLLISNDRMKIYFPQELIAYYEKKSVFS
jgi:hypothetical protein